MYMQVQTLNISLPIELVKRADFVAKKEYKNRSELIKEALRTYLISKQSWEELFAYGKKIGNKKGIKSERQVFKMVDDYRDGK